MLEKLLDLQVAYERTVLGPNAQPSEVATFDVMMRAAFPELLRAFTETIEENRQLRGLAASALVNAAPNATPLEFAGFTDPITGEAHDSLNELATERGAVAGEELLGEEHYVRLVHFEVHGGPTPAEPLKRFEFFPQPQIERAPPGNSPEPALDG